MDFAIFGAGRIGNIHAGNLVKAPDARLAYVVDPNSENAQSMAARHGAKVATVQQVFEDRNVGAVLICSSTDTHADLILAAAAAKKHIFCEKPVDLDVARARTCAAAVKAAGVTCMIGFQRRFDPTFAAAKMRRENAGCTSGSPPERVSPPFSERSAGAKCPSRVMMRSSGMRVPCFSFQVSGLWQYWQRSGQPDRKSVTRTPGPSRCEPVS